MKLFTATLSIFLLSISSCLYADDNNAVVVKNDAFHRTTSVNDDGETVVTMKKVENKMAILPGQEIVYETRVKNVSEQTVNNVVITNPIPEVTTYRIGSAYGDGVSIRYSIDNGQSFHESSQLKYNGEKADEAIAAADYDVIKWDFPDGLAAGKESVVGFHVTIGRDNN